MVVVLVVGLVVGFGGGMVYQKGQTPQIPGGVIGRRGTGNFGNANGMRATIGTILSTDSKTVTVKLTDGSSKIVILNDKTAIGKNSTASASDLVSGQTVQVFGTANTDGSITATTVQLNPEQRMMRPNVSVTPTTN